MAADAPSAGVWSGDRRGAVASVEHAPGIDVLRGISVLLVVQHHVAIRMPLNRSALAPVVPRRALLALDFNGYEAVFLFFVISGFLITGHALARDGAADRIDLRRFWARRAARIAPPLLTLLAVLVALHLLGVPEYAFAEPDQHVAVAVLSALTLWLNAYEGMTGWLPGGWDVLWSLSIEEAFYLSFPLLMWAARREEVAALGFGAFALTLPVTRAWTPSALWGEPEIWAEKAYLPGFAAIAAGCATAVLARRLSGSLPLAHGLRAVGACAVLGIAVFGDLVWPSLGQGTLGVLVAGACALVLGAWLDRAAPPARWTAPLRWVGRWSYEIYLTHMFAVYGTIHGLRALGFGKDGGGTWASPVAVLGACVLGVAFGRLVSEPARRALLARLDAPGE